MESAAIAMAERHRRLRWCLLLLSLLISWGVWRWATDLLAPANTSQAVARGRPLGNSSDLYPRWLGAREALLHHRDPYSPELTRQIQTGFYGRPLDPRRPTDPADQEAFAYPLYVVFLLSPTVFFPFPVVMRFFGWGLLSCTALSVPMWMRGIGMRVSRMTSLATMALALSTYPVVMGFYQQQLTLLVGFLLAAAVAAAARGWLAASGLLLALATIKPQIAGLLIFWLLFWAIAGWKRRKALFWGFAATMSGLMIAAEFLQPGWISEFAAAVQAYRHYAADRPILQVLLTPLGGEIASTLLLLGFLVACWTWRKTLPGSLEFGGAIALAAAITLVILDKVAAYNQVLLIPVVLWLVCRSRQGRTLCFGARASIQAVFACLGWQWASALLLACGSLGMLLTRLAVIRLPFYTIFALPPAALLSILLCLPTCKDAHSTAAAVNSIE